MLWSARGAMISAGMEPGTIDAGIGGMAVSVGLEPAEWALVMEEARQFDAVMRKEAERVVRDGTR